MNWLMNAIEKFTGALRMISNDHAYIHAGKAFKHDMQLSLATTVEYKTTFLTPASTTGYVHFRPAKIASSGDKVTLIVYEGSTGNSGGTAKTPINSNRVSSAASSVVLTEGATVTGNGTIVDRLYVGGGTSVGGNSTGSAVEEVDELVLKAATLYTISVTNGSGSTNNILVKLKWYEEPYAN